MLLITFDLVFNLWILLQKKKFLLQIANSGESIEELKAKYVLSDEDIAEMEVLGVAKQYNLISYGGDQEPGYIGDFTPLTVMHEEKKETVKQ